MKIKRSYSLIYIAFLIGIPLNAQINLQKSDLSAASVENTEIFHHKYEGNILVINILNIEHPDEIRKFDELAAKYKKKKVVFIAITDDQMLEGEENRMNQEILHFQYVSKEENNRIFNSYQTGMFKTFPIQIIIDKNGKEKYKKKGKTNKIAEKLTKRIDALLKMKQHEFIDSELQYTIN